MAPRKVLFVEDEAALQYSYKRYFEGRYTMAYAPNGAEAMRQLNHFEPDVLVLDMRLPDTDGIALLQRIRETRPTLPVVVTTASGRICVSGRLCTTSLRVNSRSARTICCCASVCRITSIAGSASCREAWYSELRSLGH